MKTPYAHGLTKLNYEKMAFYQKLYIDSPHSQSKSPSHYSTHIKKEKERRKITLKFTWNHKRHRQPKTILSKRNNPGAGAIPDLKTYARVTVIETV